jgi:hypothetical protein
VFSLTQKHHKISNKKLGTKPPPQRRGEGSIQRIVSKSMVLSIHQEKSNGENGYYVLYKNGGFNVPAKAA